MHPPQPRLARGVHQGARQKAAQATALEAVGDGRPSDAITALSTLLDSAPPSFVGWTFPIEAMFLGLRAEPGFQQVLAKLAERAK